MSLLFLNKTFLTLFSLLFLTINSQLTLQDKNIIENFISQGQSKSTGLFFEDEDALKNTKEAISVLKILGLQTKYSKEICKNISENKKIDANIITINNLLDCKMNFKSYKPDLTKEKLVELYKEAQIMDMLKMNKWDDLFTSAKSFMFPENNKFSHFKAKEGKKKSILATALGIEIMVLIAEKNSELKKEIVSLLQKSVDNLIKSNAILNDEMIVYLEKKVQNYKLNYHVIKALKSAKKIGVDIPSLNTKLYQLLNYFNTFKYEMISNIGNTYY